MNDETDKLSQSSARLRLQFVLSRLTNPDGLQTWLTVALSASQPRPGSQERLQHEYELRDVLEGAHVAHPHALIHDEGNATLALDDPGDEPLRSVASGPLSPWRFLRVAKALVVALHTLHSRGVTHHDIRPANILLNRETDAVALTGLGLASKT